MNYGKRDKRTYTCDSVMDFGKYKGQTVAHILRVDPAWFKWALETVPWVDTDETTEEIMNEQLAEFKRNNAGYSRRDGVRFKRGKKPDSDTPPF